LEVTSRRLLSACTTSTAASPAIATTTAAAVAVTIVRCRVSRRRARAVQGSGQAETGSPASQRSISSARTFGVAYRCSGFNDIALRQTASRGLSIDASIWRGGGKSPF
jgi:hypothetical protein